MSSFIALPICEDDLFQHLENTPGNNNAHVFAAVPENESPEPALAVQLFAATPTSTSRERSDLTEEVAAMGAADLPDRNSEAEAALEETEEERLARETRESEQYAWELMRAEAQETYRAQMEFMQANAHLMSAEDLAADITLFYTNESTLFNSMYAKRH